MTPEVDLREGRTGPESALEVFERFVPPQVEEGTVLLGQNLVKSFGGVQAVRDVPSIEVPARSFVGLIGPNGAGKSTLFDILNGFLQPDEGDVFLFGRKVTRMRPWDRARLGVSRTFQANHVDLDLTTFENLMSGAFRLIRGGLLAATLRSSANRRDEQAARTAAVALAQLLGLERVLDVTVRSLDFAAQRRIEIGRSLMSGPRLLLLDEPAAGLDAREAGDLLRLVKRLQSDLGLAVLLIEHYVQAVLENCDSIYVLDQGSLIAFGTPAEIVVDERVRAAYLGDADDA